MTTPYKKNGVREMKLLSAALLFFWAALAGVIPPVAADDSISVLCYIGDRRLGNVIVFDIQLAVPACNETYYDCKGRCTACYPEPDHVDYVCVDMQGKTFLK